MVAIYDDIKKLYELLASENGKVQDIEVTINHLYVHHGVDKPFIRSVFKTMALEKMALEIMENIRIDKSET